MSQAIWDDVKKAIRTPEGKTAIRDLVRASLPWITTFWPPARSIAAVVAAALPFLAAVLEALGYRLVPIGSPEAATTFALTPASPLNRSAITAVNQIDEENESDENA